VSPPPRPSLAESLTGPAKLDYDAAHLLYENGDYAGALIKYRSAYDQAKDPRLLWSAAACEKNLRHYQKAASFVKRYMREEGDKLSDSARDDAQAFLQAVAPFITQLALTVNEAGANVYVDDEMVGLTPVAEPIGVDIGAHKLRVAKAGFVEHTEDLTVSGSGDMAKTIALTPEVHEGRLVVHAGAGESIIVDARVLGVGQWEGALPSGSHLLRVTAQHKRPYQSELAILDHQTNLVQVTLEDEPSAIPPWVWIGGGAVLVAGAAVVGGYFVFRPSNTVGPPPVIGTVPDGTVQLQSLRGVRR
jgi:hypothetical protein